MRELIEATQLIGQPDAGLFMAQLNKNGQALYFGDADIVSENHWANLAPVEKANYSRLDNQWVLLSQEAADALARLDVKVSLVYDCFYFDRKTLWERRFH